MKSEGVLKKYLVYIAGYLSHVSVNVCSESDNIALFIIKLLLRDANVFTKSSAIVSSFSSCSLDRGVCSILSFLSSIVLVAFVLSESIVFRSTFVDLIVSITIFNCSFISLRFFRSSPSLIPSVFAPSNFSFFLYTFSIFLRNSSDSLILVFIAFTPYAAKTVFKNRPS